MLRPLLIALVMLISALRARSIATEAPILTAPIVQGSGEETRPSYLKLANPRPPWHVGDVSVALGASAFLVIDAATDEVLIAKNAESEFPIASLTKLITALTLTERLAVDTHAAVIFSKNAVASFGGTLGFQEGEEFSTENLIKSMLIASDNDSAVALAEYAQGDEAAFTERMKEEARAIGLKHTKIANATGLDAEGSVSTARDIATAVRYLHSFQPNLFAMLGTRSEVIESRAGRGVQLLSTNSLLGSDARILAGKTGFTDEARGTLAVYAKEPESGGEVIAVILGSEDRFAEMGKLLDEVFMSYEWPSPHES
ncbi:MAG: D-alanyl-D-alanine carboxypeptidase [Parcubacteria group bacterium]|nr:D-alanyl-D-alanine carboxypeptidase [Parcubacteria group bacterium]